MYYLFKFGQFMVLLFPLKFSYAIAAAIGFIYGHISRRDRKAIFDNLKVVLGDKVGDRTIRVYVRRCFINFAKYLVDFFRFSLIDKEYIDKHVIFEGIENIEEALKTNKGVIMLSSHIGNWELGAAAVTALGFPLHVIALDHKDSKVNSFFIKTRQSRNVNVISTGLSLKKCFQVLKDNQLLAILGDRDFSESGVEVDFFGKPAIMPKGPALFALKTGAPIVGTFIVREKHEKFRMYFDKPIYFNPSGDRKGDMIGLMNIYMKVIENRIRQYPDQWYIFRHMWSA